jgi:hypothetical protein
MVSGIVIASPGKKPSHKSMSVDTYLYLVDNSLLEERVAPAVASFLKNHDASAAESLLQEATSKTGVPENLREYYRSESEKLLRGNLPDEILDETTGDVLTDPERIKEYRAERTLNRFLVLQLCVSSDGKYQTTFQFNRGPFAEYLRSHSHWLDETFSLSNDVLWTAQRLQLPIGGDAWILSSSQTVSVLEAVKKVPLRHDRGLRKEQQDLLSALQAAANQDSRYRVLVTMF